VGRFERRLDIQGLTPRIGSTVTRNASDIALYSFTRKRLELGFTSSF
jgi:hypothetical protein